MKEMIISEIQNRIGDARDMLVVDASRLDGVTANQFRLALQDKSIGAITVKNSLARQALKNLGVSGLDDVLSGPSTIVWGSEDIVALSKEITKWAKELEPLEVRGGTVEGESLDAEGVDRLSKSPGREELLSIIAGQLLGPGAQLAAALLGPGGKLAGQMTTMSEGEESAEE